VSRAEGLYETAQLSAARLRGRWRGARSRQIGYRGLEGWLWLRVLGDQYGAASPVGTLAIDVLRRLFC